ncbi:MAG: hypothetical protein MUF87_16770 [Anaerolineae bacterium]|jgi:hypothetical protein|nr:hypothetical protein [Anaerolineae bacterium]
MWMKKLTYVSFSLLILVVVLHLLYISSIEGQATANNLQAVLLEYQQSYGTHDSTKPQSLLIRLVTPLETDGDPTLFIPDRADNPNAPIIQIANVGADHVCFDITDDTKQFVSCVPFTNIAVIRELF